MPTRRKVVLGLAATAVAASVRAGSGGHTIVIENMRFDPPQLTVRPGERVTWVNKDLFPHTATATAKAFDSGEIPPNASWTFVPRTKGELPYTCKLHPTMNGALSVR
jgi:plastocyanin